MAEADLRYLPNVIQEAIENEYDNATADFSHDVSPESLTESVMSAIGRYREKIRGADEVDIAENAIYHCTDTNDNWSYRDLAIAALAAITALTGVDTDRQEYVESLDRIVRWSEFKRYDNVYGDPTKQDGTFSRDIANLRKLANTLRGSND